MAYLTQHEVAVAVEACAFAAVPHVAPWPISRHGVVIGEIAWDQCDCGQLVVAEVRRFPSVDFPVEAVDHTAECGSPWIVTQYTLSLLRCVDVGDENGSPPSIASLTASAARNSSDMSLVMNAVRCCLNTAYDNNTVAAYEMGSQEITGPLGACAGFDMTFFVGFTNDCGCV